MPTEKYPGVVEFFLESSLSPSQLWMEKTTEALFVTIWLAIQSQSFIASVRLDIAVHLRNLGYRSGNVPSHKLVAREHSGHW